MSDRTDCYHSSLITHWFFGGTDQAEERAKEDEADGVSLSSLFRPPSPCHQKPVMSCERMRQQIGSVTHYSLLISHHCFKISCAAPAADVPCVLPYVRAVPDAPVHEFHISADHVSVRCAEQPRSAQAARVASLSLRRWHFHQKSTLFRRTGSFGALACAR